MNDICVLFLSKLAHLDEELREVLKLRRDAVYNATV